MIDEAQRNDLIQYRLEQADQAKAEANNLLLNGFLRGTVNRIYYAMFYGVMALALKHRFETSKHQQLLGWFNRNFIHTEIIEVRFGKLYREAFANRMDGDYEPFVEFEQESVNQMFAEMQLFLERIKEEIVKQQ